jgi:hypothetical protein
MKNSKLIYLMILFCSLLVISACSMNTSASPEQVLTDSQMERYILAKEDLSESDFDYFKTLPDLPALSEQADYTTYLYTAVKLNEEQFENLKEHYFSANTNYETYREFSDSLLSMEELLEEPNSVSNEAYAYHVIGIVKFISPQ